MRAPAAPTRRRTSQRGPGLSAYALSDGAVYPTYVTTARGLEPVMGYYGLLERTPVGRHEEGEEVFWLRRRDEYSPSLGVVARSTCPWPTFARRRDSRAL